jgi:hypothetical protein
MEELLFICNTYVSVVGIGELNGINHHSFFLEAYFLELDVV